MARTLSLGISFIFLILLVVILYGGLGALMGFGYYGENLTSRYPWLITFWNPISYLWVIGWLYGIVMCGFKFRALIRRITNRMFETWAYPDLLLGLGHLLIASGIIITQTPQPWDDLMYLLLIWAGFFYALGVGEFARTAR